MREACDAGSDGDADGPPRDAEPDVPRDPSRARISIIEPPHARVDDIDTATLRVDRFGRMLTVPFITSARSVTVAAEINGGPCPDRVSFSLSGDGLLATADAAIACGDPSVATARIGDVAPGEHTLAVQAYDSTGTPFEPTADSIVQLARVGVGDVFLSLGESTTEGYGVPLGDGAYQPTDIYPMDRWDRFPPGTVSADGRTTPQVGPTSLTPGESGCGGTTTLGCPVGATYAGGPAVSGPVYFSGYGAMLADRLTDLLGHPVVVWNLAYGGHTTGALLRRADQGLHHSSVALQLETLAPSHALIYTGINDSYCTDRCGGDASCLLLCATPDDDIRAMVDWATGVVGDETRVFVGDPTFHSDSDLAPYLEAVARLRAVRSVRMGPELYQYFLHRRAQLPDGIHPNRVGYGVIAQLFAERIVANAPQRSPRMAYLPSEVGRTASTVIAIAGVRPASTVTYTFMRPDGSVSFGPSALPCGEPATPTADAIGFCSFPVDDVTISPAGRWMGEIDDGFGGRASAPLDVR